MIRALCVLSIVLLLGFVMGYHAGAIDTALQLSEEMSDQIEANQI